MNIALDGRIYERQGLGGISRIFNETMPIICALETDITIDVLTRPSVRQTLPEHASIVHRTFAPLDALLRPATLWHDIPLRTRRAMLAHAHSAPNAIWHSTYYTLLPGNGAARILSVYDMIHEELSELQRTSGAKAFVRQKQAAIRNADHFLCISQTTQRDLCRHYSIAVERTHVAPLAASPVFRPVPGSKRLAAMTDDRPYFLYIGRRRGYKNFETLLRAFAAWPQNQDFTIVAVGPTWGDDEMAGLVELGLDDRIVRLGNVDDATLCILYNQAVALIYPSRYEGFGIPILEAMACGCPVIASSIPSSLEIAPGCALFFDPDETDSLLSAMDAALAQNSLRDLVARGQARAQQFSWDRTAQLTLALYRTINAA